ncbi:MAG: hypothetical protein ACLRPX_11550 [Ruthenibacterium sp.]
MEYYNLRKNPAYLYLAEFRLPPTQMALSTLQACFQAGHYPSLSAKDRKIMCSPLLCAYQEIFDFMKRHGCKVEQESFMAIEL